MFGVLIVAVAAVGIVALTAWRRDLPLLLLIAIFIMTPEQGEGFTSFQGSIFFNQDFLSLANVKLIEVILYAYTGTLILLNIPIGRKIASSPLRFLYWFWLAWLAVLLFVQFATRGSIDPQIFRGILFGWALVYTFVSVVTSRRLMRRVMTFAFGLIIIKALWLMLMFIMGRGDYTSRGHSPIFWDDKLLEAFVWAALIFLLFILQRRGENGNWPIAWAYIGLAIITLLIALSLRRNYLGQLACGAIFVLFHRAGQIRWRRFIPFALIATLLLGIVFTAGQVAGDRLPLVKQMTEYAQLLNFTSPAEFVSMPANQVHLFNVQTYATLLSNYPGIRLFGRSAAPTEDFWNFNRQYLSSLGLAHNGPLRAVFDFGIGGLLIWAGFFYLAFRAVRRCQFEKLEPWERALVIGTAATVFGHFVVTMAVVPPFFTTFKGLFFFLFMVFVLDFYARESRVPERENVRATALFQTASHAAD